MCWSDGYLPPTTKVMRSSTDSVLTNTEMLSKTVKPAGKDTSTVPESMSVITFPHIHRWCAPGSHRLYLGNKCAVRSQTSDVNTRFETMQWSCAENLA